jgi:PAS domain S-box-containing protein
LEQIRIAGMEELKKIKVLLVEDNKFDQMSFVRFMKEDKRFDYSIAESVAIAKDLVIKEKYDVIITDHQLGDGTAFDIIKLKLNAPVIVTTGHGNEEIAVKVLKLGAKDYLIKDMEGNYLKVMPFIIENAIKHNKDEESLLRFAGIVESMEDAIIYCSVEGKILSWNPGAEKIFGYSPSEIYDKPIALLFPVTNNLDASIIIEKVKNAGHINHLETICLKKDQSEIDVSYSASPIRDTNDNIIGISTIVTDITERKKAQNTLFEKEELYRSVVESLSEGLIITDNDGQILFVNSKMEELTNFSKEEMIGQVVHQLLFPTRLVEQEKDAVSGEIKISKKLDIKINKKDGNTFLGHVNVTPYCNTKGEILGIVGTVTDITISNREEELESLLIAATKSFNAVKISDPGRCKRHARRDIDWRGPGGIVRTKKGV